MSGSSRPGSVDIIASSKCECDFCQIQRDLKGSKDSPETRPWHWARLYRYYLVTVFESLRSIEKGDRLGQATIDETEELAAEAGKEFEAEMQAALKKELWKWRPAGQDVSCKMVALVRMQVSGKYVLRSLPGSIMHGGNVLAVYGLRIYDEEDIYQFVCAGQYEHEWDNEEEADQYLARKRVFKWSDKEGWLVWSN